MASGIADRQAIEAAIVLSDTAMGADWKIKAAYLGG
jgi:hypothetical protein